MYHAHIRFPSIEYPACVQIYFFGSVDVLSWIVFYNSAFESWFRWGTRFSCIFFSKWLTFLIFGSVYGLCAGILSQGALWKTNKERPKVRANANGYPMICFQDVGM